MEKTKTKGRRRQRQHKKERSRYLVIHRSRKESAAFMSLLYCLPFSPVRYSRLGEREREIGTSKKKKSSYLRSLGVWLTWSYVSLGSFRKGTRTRRHLLLVYNHLRSARFVLVSLGYGGPSPKRVRLLLAIRHGKQIRRI